uniref:Uncharacterized protein n=1 Tax=Oryza brachyantha TaxID=4533 RepID=J3L0L1_ORYBR
MGGFAAVLSGVIDLFSIVACVLPLVAFGVTTDWSRVFDCFGGITIAADMVASYLKTGMLLFVLGVNHETFVFIFDAVLCNFMELCLLGSSLFFYWSHKSYHGHDVAVARYSLVLLFLFMTGIATAIFGMKLNWLFSDKHIWWYLVGTIINTFASLFHFARQ